MSIDPVSRLEQAIDLAEMSHNVSLDGIRAAIEQHVAEAKCALLRDRIEHQVAEAQNERDEARAEVERLRKALHRLACLGNGDQYGNSDGNQIALEALAATEAKP